MKALLEQWRGHLDNLKEDPDGLVESKKDQVITFDFDDTLSLSHWGDEEDDWVHDGPHLPMIKRYKKYKDQGYKVYIVTSRPQEFLDDKNQWYTYLPNSTPNKKYFPEFQMPVGEFVKEYNLHPEAVIFTNGSLKVNVLKTLQSALHHDDDIEEIEAAEKAGIKTVLSDPYKNTSVTESNESQDSKKVSKVVIRDDKGKILILQRSEGENNWDLPGGHIHYGESQLEGCKRETKEETNLDLSDLELVDKDRNVTFYQASRPRGTIKLQPEEHIKYKWINPSDISGVDMRHNLKSAINKALSLEEQNEDFQKTVKHNHRKMKIRLIGGGENKYNVGGKMKKPSYKRSKSAPVGFGGSLEENK